MSIPAHFLIYFCKLFNNSGSSSFNGQSNIKSFKSEYEIFKVECVHEYVTLVFFQNFYLDSVFDL